MRKLLLLSFATLLAPALSAQSVDFVLSQHGNAVGTASYSITQTPQGFDSTSLVRVQMKGLSYSLSKTEHLSPTSGLRHVQLSAIVNGSAVNVNADSDPKAEPAETVLIISANGRSTTTHLAQHSAAVFLPDFDPGALQTLLTLAAARNNRDLWAIIPKNAGSIASIELATYADERGTLDGQPIAVHHLIATYAGGSTDLFSGPDNQLLQAELPQPGFALVRKGFILTPPAKPGAPPPAQ
ncbi:MAG: hypothetical protein WAN35_17780 [Terracidiphilus sp.]